LLLEDRTFDLNSELTSILCEAGQDGDEALSQARVFGWHRLKGRRHENIEAIQAAVKMELTGLQKEAFISCFQDLQKRWQQ
jgi:hypothetical protein